jgi:hypothetical protein
MTQPPQPTERFDQHSRLSELVTALGFRRYPLFLTGLLCEEPGGLLHHRFLPQGPAPLAITGSEVLGVVPLEVTEGLLEEFHRLADRHEHGYMVEHVLELLATS